MPGRGTEAAMFRCPPALWAAFGQAARDAGTNRAELLRAFIRWYLHEPGATMPRRPAQRDVET